VFGGDLSARLQIRARPTRSRIAVEAFFGPCAGDVVVFDGGTFDVEIDAIEQRAGDSLAITLDLERAAAAFALQIAEISARTGIHRRDEHELGRERDAAGPRARW